MFHDLTARLRDPESLIAKMLGSGIWTVMGFGIGSVLRLLGNLILTRILLPDAFGLMALIIAIHVGLVLFTDVGLNQSVMRDKRGDEPGFLRLIWTLKCIRGISIAVIILVISVVIGVLGPQLAPPASVYADPRLPWLLAVSSLSALLQAAASTNQMLANRHLKVRPIVLIELGSQVVALATSVGLAVLTQSVWAILAGMIVRNLLETTLSHLVLKGPSMRVVWDSPVALEIWNFGKWLIISSAGTFISRFGDRFIFGYLISNTLLGIYSIAVIWIELGTAVISQICGVVFIPSFRMLREQNPERIGQAVRRAYLGTMALCYAAFAGFVALGGWMIDLLYSDAYEAAQGFVPLLAFKILFMQTYPLHEYLLTLGRSRYAALAFSVDAAVAIPAALLAFSLAGFEAAIAAYTVSNMMSCLFFALHREVRAHVDWRLSVPAILLPAVLLFAYLQVS
ncbi:MAG: oligosaccharide flippase family protein [Pseudomonadota bacterium]